MKKTLTNIMLKRMKQRKPKETKKQKREMNAWLEIWAN